MNTMKMILFLFFLLPLCGSAHEIRPALLRVTQTGNATYLVQLKLPRTGTLVPVMEPVFPEWFKLEYTSLPVETGEGVIFSWKASTPRDIHGMAITMQGTEAGLVDVFVIVELLRGENYSLVIPSSRQQVIIPESKSSNNDRFFLLGVKHILEGYDHLAFVTALMLLAVNRKRIFLTVTAFTLAHSITLSLSVLGFIGLPSAPVEITIAISILFLSVELVHHLRGRKVLSASYPWAVAFLFGLMHGFGFAGVLHDIGLPKGQVVSSLLLFNIGVEVGQLVYIALVMLVMAVISRLQIANDTKWKWAITYCIGTVAVFWILQRSYLLFLTTA